MKMDLSIEIMDRVPKRRQVMTKIQIGDFEEYLDVFLGWWTINDYERQWTEALERLAKHDKSCFIVAIDDPGRRKFLEWWPLYKIGKKIHVQNHILVDDLYEERIGNNPFTRETCYDFIPPYRSHTQEGNKISEWVVDWK
jgi:hypothetical protein